MSEPNLLTTDVELYYYDKEKALKKGVFVVKLPTTGELTNLYKMCEKKNTRTGAVIDTDNVQFSKYRVAVAIVDCPLTDGLKPWAELALQAKTTLIENNTQEDFFFRINEVLRTLNKYDKEAVPENLFEPQ